MPRCCGVMQMHVYYESGARIPMQPPQPTRCPLARSPRRMVSGCKWDLNYTGSYSNQGMVSQYTSSVPKPRPCDENEKYMHLMTTYSFVETYLIDA